MGDFVDGEAGVGEADFERLTYAGDFALTQGGKRADAGVERGDAVYQREVCLDGGQVAVAGEGHEAAHSLTDGVEADLVAVGAVLAVSRDVYHDDLGVQLLELVVAEAHDVNGAGAEVLQEDVGDFDQLAEDLLALVGAEVDGEALLATVVLHPVGGLPANAGAVCSALVAAHRLHLDNLGAHAGEHQGAAGASLIASKVQHSYAL